MPNGVVIMLAFDGSGASVTLKNDHTWEATSDPHNVFPVDNGQWKFTPPTGTELYANNEDIVVLSGFSFDSASNGQDGDAVKVAPGPEMAGDFRVTTVVD